MREETRLFKVRSGGRRRSLDCAAIVKVDVQSGECGELRACFGAVLRCSSAAGQREGHVIAKGLYRIEARDVHSLGAALLSLCCQCGDGVEAQSWSCCCSSAFAGILPQKMCFHMSPQFPLFFSTTSKIHTNLIYHTLQQEREI